MREGGRDGGKPKRSFCWSQVQDYSILFFITTSFSLNKLIKGKQVNIVLQMFIYISSVLKMGLIYSNSKNSSLFQVCHKCKYILKKDQDSVLCLYVMQHRTRSVGRKKLMCYELPLYTLGLVQGLHKLGSHQGCVTYNMVSPFVYRQQHFPTSMWSYTLLPHDLNTLPISSPCPAYPLCHVSSVLPDHQEFLLNQT